MPVSKSAPRRRTAAAPANSEEGFASWSDAVAQLIQMPPGAITTLIETLLRAEDEYEVPQGRGKRLGKKSKRKRMDEGDLFAHVSLLGQALEELRYEVERNRQEAIGQIEHLRQYLLEAGQTPGINPKTFLLVLQQFAMAKLDIGEELRGLAEQMLADLASSSRAGDAASIEEAANGLKDVADSLNGNPFAVHAEVSEFSQTLRADVRTKLVASVLAQKAVPALRDAALGWLLDDAAGVRQIVAQMLEKDAGNNSGTTLRRMIALRNWVAEADRPALDRAIKASKKKVACAGWPAAKVLTAYASGYDGAGAQSVFIIAGQGRKRAFAALLFKQDIGVRDAWVDHGAQAEIDAKLQALEMQMDLLPVSLEYIAVATRHFLGVSVRAGAMPPYGLLEVAELAGLTNVNPEFQPVDALLPSLCAEIASRRATPQAIAKALKTSASWSNKQPIVWSWFEESDEADAILARCKLSTAKRKAALLATPIQQRRRWWAELIGWTAYTMKDGGASGWEDYALVARELMGERPLDEFGIMNEIAETTLRNNSGRGS
jgi:hypothetical protein